MHAYLVLLVLVDEKVPSVHFRTLNMHACLFQSRMYRVFRPRPFNPVRMIVMWPFVTSVESILGSVSLELERNLLIVVGTW
jgi:hypothetical protein